MKIVIDINDEDYKRIQDIPDVFNSLTSRAYSAIRNGTPLPSAEPEKSECSWYGNDGRCHFAEQEMDECDDCISRQEAIRVAEQGQIQGYEWQFKKLCTLSSVKPERKPGKWINVDGSTNTADCSCCGDRGRAWMNYCYECGAKMEVGP